MRGFSRLAGVVAPLALALASCDGSSGGSSSGGGSPNVGPAPIRLRGAVATPLPVGIEPGAVADFDLDGAPDVAVLTANALHVLFGVHSPPGVTETTVPVAGASGLTVVDFDGNGVPDVVLRDAALGFLVLLSDGARDFVAHIVTGPSFPLGSVFRFGEFDSDGVLDVVIAAGSSIETYRGFGLDGFEGPIGLLPLPRAVFALHGTADFDGDGALDLLAHTTDDDACSTGAETFVLFGDGAGRFLAEVSQHAVSATALFVDFDGDGDPDVVASTHTGASCDRTRHDLIRNVGPPCSWTRESLPFTSGRGSVAVGDFRRDGRVDFVTGGPTVSFFGGDGAGGYLAVGRIPGIAGDGPVAWRIDADRSEDLLVVDRHAVFSAIGREDGTFDTGIHYPVRAGPSDFLVGDFDLDGRPDIVYPRSGGLLIISGLGRRQFTVSETLVGSVASPRRVRSADADGDGDLDVLVSEEQRYFTLVRNDGGTFVVAERWRIRNNESEVAFADIDGDGRWDVLNVHDATGDGYAVLANPSGGYAPPIFFAAPRDTRDIEAADWTGDGLADLVVATPEALYLLAGDGRGGFAAGVPFHSAKAITDITQGDLDGDGLPEIVAAERGASDTATLSVFLAGAPGGAPPVRSGGASYAGSADHVATGDLDRDGRAEVVVADRLAASVIVWRYDALAGLVRDVARSASPAAAGVAIGDADGDGEMDVVVCDFDGSMGISSRMTVLYNETFD